MAADLGSFLEAAGARGLVWGENDCLMMAANWLLLLSAKDPAAEWRGTYDDQDGAARILAREGGIQAIMAKGATAIGAYLVSPLLAATGAVGVVLVPAGETMVEAAAIRTGIGWAVLDADGLAVGDFVALSAWAVI